MCYKDKTWCTYGQNCIDSKKCERNFTEEEKLKAIKWWGNEDFPLAIFAEKPKCFNDGKLCNNINKE